MPVILSLLLTTTTSSATSARICKVEESAAGTRLTVLEGAAQFRFYTFGSTAVALRAGMSAMLTDGESSPRLDRKADLNSAAWATHEFHFIDAPLADVLHTLSTYYHVHLTADNMSKRLTADFDTAEISTASSPSLSRR